MSTLRFEPAGLRDDDDNDDDRSVAKLFLRWSCSVSAGRSVMSDAFMLNVF